MYIHIYVFWFYVYIYMYIYIYTYIYVYIYIYTCDQILCICRYVSNNGIYPLQETLFEPCLVADFQNRHLVFENSEGSTCGHDHPTSLIRSSGSLPKVLGCTCNILPNLLYS